MSDIVAELRERALQAEQDGDPIALLDEAAGEIERLRSWVRIQDAVIRSGNVAALTDEERKALKTVLRRLREDYFAGRFSDSAEIAAVIDGLLERLGGVK